MIGALHHRIGIVKKRATADGAGAHGDHVFGLGHLVVETHDLGRHLLGDRAGNDHQVGLSGRGTEDFGAEPADVPFGHAGGDHLDGTAGKADVPTAPQQDIDDQWLDIAASLYESHQEK